MVFVVVFCVPLIIISYINQDPVVADLGSKINSISFCPTQPHNFVVSASSRLAIFDGFSCEIKKTLSRFRAEAYSAHYRMDGKLIAAGSEDPIIQVFFFCSFKFISLNFFSFISHRFSNHRLDFPFALCMVTPIQSMSLGGPEITIELSLALMVRRFAYQKYLSVVVFRFFLLVCVSVK
jgi:hypothetical protein